MNIPKADKKRKEHHKNKHDVSSKKMRIIVFDFHSPMMIEVIKSLQAKSVEIVYWVASKGDFIELWKKRDVFPTTIFHNADDAAAGISAPDVDASLFKPVDPVIIKTFFGTEIQSLVMMDGIDLTNTSVLKKTHLYHTYLKYWFGVFETLKPDAVIFSDVPHMSFKYVAYCIGKYLGIKQAILRDTQIAGRYGIIDDITDYKKLKKNLETNKGKNFTLDDLSPDIRDYYEKQQRSDKSPWFFRKGYAKKRAYSLYRFLPHPDAIKKNIKSLLFFKATYLYIRMLFMKRCLPSLEPFCKPVWAIKWQERRWNKLKQVFKQEYIQHQKNPDYSKKYIYVALHNQPERSTGTEGGVFVDQILMIDLLSYVIPNDWIIYVKENHMQWVNARSHKGRFKGYTEEIAQKRNVFVVPVETSTFDLTKNAQATATVTSTAGWEAVLRGKPALIFGYTWYMYCNGVLRISDLSSAEEAIEKIKKGYAPDQQKVINFLKAADQSMIHGYLSHRWRDSHDLNITLIKNDEENIKSIAEGFYRELTD